MFIQLITLRKKQKVTNSKVGMFHRYLKTVEIRGVIVFD